VSRRSIADGIEGAQHANRVIYLCLKRHAVAHGRGALGTRPRLLLHASECRMH